MQVSWIDADRIKALVAQLAPQEPCVDESPQVMEIETAPNAAESWGIAIDWMEPDAGLYPAAEVTETAPAEAGYEELQEETLANTEEEEAEHGHVLHNPAAALPLSRIRDKLRAIRQRATEAGILTRVSETLPTTEDVTVIGPPVTASVVESVPDAETPRGCDDEAEARTEAATESSVALPHTPTFEIPQGSRDERLAAFAGWARQVLHEDGGHVLVMSDDGEVLWGGEAKAGLVLSTMMAWGAAIRASASSACETPPVIRQPLASGNVLTVIPCETAHGMMHVAVAAPAGLTDELALVLRGALCAAMHMPG
ncbi:hypothetical protein [Prosthecobacter sp.]|uniref:hypothetical protein n=1 Tax=Prosthecobacter sp. TaxID=1965333 RepID=UPI002AB90107|nr:hypothetical protein [Prosthecobacter sp.]MDZ4405200.1 hypothetical protein [Prosthecobacter sp.]